MDWRRWESLEIRSAEAECERISRGEASERRMEKTGFELVKFILKKTGGEEWRGPETVGINELTTKDLTKSETH